MQYVVCIYTHVQGFFSIRAILQIYRKIYDLVFANYTAYVQVSGHGNSFYWGLCFDTQPPGTRECHNASSVSTASLCYLYQC